MRVRFFTSCFCQEWQFRRVGPLGIFLIDMRGARLLGSGSIVDGPLMSATQKNALKEALASGIMGLIVGSELPFVGDTPDEIRKKVVEGGSGSFLVEHWPYHVDELVWSRRGGSFGKSDLLGSRQTATFDGMLCVLRGACRVGVCRVDCVVLRACRVR